MPGSQARQLLTDIAGMLLSDSAPEAQNALAMLRKITADAGITAGDFKERFAKVFAQPDTTDKLVMTREELTDFIARGVTQERNNQPTDKGHERLKRQRDAAIHNTRLTGAAFGAALFDAWINQNDASNYLWLGAIIMVWLVFLRYRS